MEIAYKYCSAGGLAILENLELKITPPNQFNDPFEFTPRMICSDPRQRTTEILSRMDRLRFLYDGEKEAGLFKGTFRQYRKFVRDHKETIVQGISPWLATAGEEVGWKLLNKVSMSWGLLCLSQRRDSLLMWGHYCDSHQGIVLGFDISHKVFKGVLPQVTAVNYVRQRVTFDSSWLESDPRIKAFEEQMILSKNEDWRYEMEMRQVFNLSGLRQRLLKGKEAYFLALPPESIASVTLGLRCSLKEKVRAALQQNKLSRIAVDRAVLDPNEFTLKFERDALASTLRLSGNNLPI